MSSNFLLKPNEHRFFSKMARICSMQPLYCAHFVLNGRGGNRQETHKGRSTHESTDLCLHSDGNVDLPQGNERQLRIGHITPSSLKYAPKCGFAANCYIQPMHCARLRNMRTIKDALSCVEEILPNARTLTDSAITLSRNPETIQEAIRRLAAATQYQNIALDNLCAAVRKLGKL